MSLSLFSALSLAYCGDDGKFSSFVINPDVNNALHEGFVMIIQYLCGYAVRLFQIQNLTGCILALFVMALKTIMHHGVRIYDGNNGAVSCPSKHKIATYNDKEVEEINARPESHKPLNLS